MEPYAVRGKLLLDGALTPGAVVVEGGRIGAVLRAPRDGDLPPAVIETGIVAPGLIDLQLNGAFGAEVGADPEAIRHLAARLPETGVTAFLPTRITAPPDHYQHVFEAFERARDAAGARPLGLHLEGPFLSPARPGAHRRDLIEAADPALLDLFLAGPVRLVTLAPERPGALARIRRLRGRGIVVSLGHTDATLEEFAAGVEAGATMATHLYNAMSPFAHRAPGAVGAALVDDRVTVGLIADGVHSHPAAVRLALRAKGPQGVALVTDAMAATGMPPGEYALGGRRVAVDATSARLPDGTLAGAVLTLDRAVRNLVRWGAASPAAALRMAGEVPARLLGLDNAGRLELGRDADLALFDDELRVQSTIVGGETVYRREEP
jgi:N-acetylglucosamine-6-phosphate deacetylase